VEGPAKQIFLGTATPSNESCLVLSPSEDLWRFIPTKSSRTHERLKLCHRAPNTVTLEIGELKPSILESLTHIALTSLRSATRSDSRESADTTPAFTRYSLSVGRVQATPFIPSSRGREAAADVSQNVRGEFGRAAGTGSKRKSGHAGSLEAGQPPGHRGTRDPELSHDLGDRQSSRGHEDGLGGKTERPRTLLAPPVPSE